METVYIETSIISYLVADPSRDLVTAASQQVTRDWWQRRRESFACLASQEVVTEASRGDPEQIRRRLAVLSAMPRVAVSADAQEPARLFLATCLPERPVTRFIWRSPRRLPRTIFSPGIAVIWPTRKS